jgi:hypothetical protein
MCYFIHLIALTNRDFINTLQIYVQHFYSRQLHQKFNLNNIIFYLQNRVVCYIPHDQFSEVWRRRQGRLQQTLVQPKEGRPGNLKAPQTRTFLCQQLQQRRLK